MKKLIIAIFIALIILSATACNAKHSEEEPLNTSTAENTERGYINIKPQEAKEQLENDQAIILLDVRTQSEYSEEHIPGSILIPLDELRENAESVLTDKNAKIFVYCRSGRRSITAANTLLELGYTNVYNLGGIIDWPYEKE